PQTLSLRGRLLYRLMMGLAVHSSAAVITISQHACGDLARRYRLPAGRLVVTPLAAAAPFCPQPPVVLAAMRARYGLPARYVLYVGSNKPHKNLERLVLAWEQLGADERGDVQLVLAGHEETQHPELSQLVAARGLGGRVRRLANVAEADLPALYSGADVFAFVSYYEGFGLPPLEAMACGAPVLCAAASSLPEVVGDAAVLVDPFSVEAINAGLRQLLASPPLCDELRARGLRRAGTFSWQRTARMTLGVYERSAGQP
ncbi:MAG: glycosyltransferase family 4 protein, partial [Oscillochloris sp.]|nr:glycosyltransferase family 4 protein [Oscillochloris sp.]